ncbi:MAG: hypothetical protein KA184_17590 [Candidatus Hydrogenedentes bacterium]|nr:hypothetical protein [Candidatus Hydrogenedentota bacterium]
MAAFSLRRFTKPETLRLMSREHLLALLSPYRDYFASRGLTVPGHGENIPLDCDRLVAVFLSPDMSMPMELVESLYLINELATPKGMDAILREARGEGIHLSLPWKPTAMDVAICAFLADRNLLERIHHQHAMLKRRTFMYFRTLETPPALDAAKIQEALPSLEKELDDYFYEHNRGRHCHVYHFEHDGAFWLTVRHGDVFRREVSVEDAKTVTFVFRPECFNTVVYAAVEGELRVYAGSDEERDMYRRIIGERLFGSEFTFWGADKYSCEPLRSQGPSALAVTDVAGIEWARLTEVKCEQQRKQRRVLLSRSSSDLFEGATRWEEWFPDDAQIVRASFKVKFRHARTPQSISLCPPNIATYSQDGDCALTERWLRARGFIRTGAAT